MKHSIKTITVLIVILMLSGCAENIKPEDQEAQIPGNNEVIDNEINVEADNTESEDTQKPEEEKKPDKEKKPVVDKKPVDDKKPEKKPVYTTELYTKKESIAFETITKNDDTLDKGKEVIDVKGEKGSKTKHYKITYKDGVKISDDFVKEEVTKKPINQIVHIGTKEASFNGKALGKAMMDLINADRKKIGVAPLVWSEELYKGAAIRSDEIIIRFSHTRPNDTQWNTVSALARGENIAYGYNSTQSAHNGFQSSPGHKANNMNQDFKSIAISVSRNKNGSLYWAVLFGS